MSSKNSSFSLRALNPDDDQLVRQLCALYDNAALDSATLTDGLITHTESTHPQGLSTLAHDDSSQSEATSSYPFTEVSHASFWKDHAGQRFISVCVQHARHAVAGHFGLRTDALRRDVCELLFPFMPFVQMNGTPPHDLEELSQLKSEIDELLTSHAKRKGWRWLVAYLPAAVLGVHDIAKFCFGLRETAILPLHRNLSQHSTCYHGDVVAYIRPLVTPNSVSTHSASNTRALSEKRSTRGSRYGTNRYTEALRWLEHQAEFHIDSPEWAPHTGTNSTLHDSAEPIQSRMSRRLGARITDLRPNFLSSLDAITDKLTAYRASAASTPDPHCVTVQLAQNSSEAGRVDAAIGLLEEHSYRFCGITPLFTPFNHVGPRLVFVLDPQSQAGQHDSILPFVLSNRLREESTLARFIEHVRARAIAAEHSNSGKIPHTLTEFPWPTQAGGLRTATLGSAARSRA